MKGTVLEIGPGCGASLRYIPKDITWVGVEPNPFMGRYLYPRLATFKKPALLKTSYAESLPMEDDSVDVVVSNLVLCSVKDLSKALWEVLRVLKPGGSFRFWDHVAAPEGTLSRFLQDLLTPAWRIVADGCCMNRDILGYLQRAGFSKLEFRTYNVPLQFFLMANHIGGIGFKAG